MSRLSASRYWKVIRGMASGEWKRRYNNHTESFRKISKKNQSALSLYVWKLKEQDIRFTLHWTKVANAQVYSKETKRCFLCSREKLEIMRLLKDHPMRALNKREEIIRQCIHRKNHLLGMIDFNAQGNNELICEGAVPEVPPLQNINVIIQDTRSNCNDAIESSQDTEIFGKTRSGRVWRPQVINHDPG